MTVSHWLRKHARLSMQEAGLQSLQLGKVRAGRQNQWMGGIEMVGEGEGSLRGLVSEGYLRCYQSH